MIIQRLFSSKDQKIRRFKSDIKASKEATFPIPKDSSYGKEFYNNRLRAGRIVNKSKFDELVDGRKGGDVINSLSGDKEAKLRIIDRATKPSFKSGLTENIRKKLNNIPTKSINKIVKKL